MDSEKKIKSRKGRPCIYTPEEAKERAKECQRLYREKTKGPLSEQRLIHMREYQRKNKDKIKIIAKRCYEKNKEQILARAKEKYVSQKKTLEPADQLEKFKLRYAKAKEQKKKYYLTHREDLLAKAKQKYLEKKINKNVL